MTAVLGTTATRALRSGIPLWTLAGLAVVVAAVTLPAFRTSTSLGSLLASLAPVLCVAAGQALVVMFGGVDLSVGAVVGVTTVLVATGDGWSGVLLGLMLAAAVGAGNGIGVLSGVNPLIMTLAMAGVVQGIALLILDQPGGTIPDPVLTVLTRQFGTVPVTFLAALVALLLTWYASAQTRFGRTVQAAGYEQATARRIGLPWRRATLLAYGAAGLLAGLGGLAVVARIYSGDALAGNAFVLDSITAVLVGGVALSGGRGSVLTVLPAATLLAVAGQVIVLTGTDTNYQYIINGLVLIVAMLLYRAGGAEPTIMSTLRGALRMGRPA